MDGVHGFFRKYFLSTIGIILIFFMVNTALLVVVLLAAWSQSTEPEIPIQTIGEQITADEEGNIHSSHEVAKILQQNEGWAMLLDDAGQVIWQQDMPKSLPRSYTSSQIASFSRWYLEGYPVLVQVHPRGLLVIGMEKNSLIKYNISTDETYIMSLLIGIAGMVLMNLVVILVLFWYHTRKIEKAVAPILEGIDTMVEGLPINLKDHGELSEIKEKLNIAGRHLRQKEKAREDWIHGISHDIRTPLSLILGYASEIEEDLSIPEETQTQGKMIRAQGVKIKALITDLNLVSRLEYSMHPLNKKRIYPLEIARRVVSEFLNQGLESKYELTLEASKESAAWAIEGDPSLLERMLTNVILNSMTHNPRGSSIVVSVQKTLGTCVFLVSDNGVGVTDKQLFCFNQEEYYKKRYRATGESTRGFGLRLVYQIVKAHGGEIRFEHNHPNGLAVSIGIPVIEG